MARLCTVKYESPKPSNFKKAFMHLTNYSLNKKNQKYKFEEGEDFKRTGSKRTFSFIMEYLSKEYDIDTKVLWEEIKDLTRMLLASIHPFLIFEFDC
jgi:tubulin polyglutamylase TTLL6/13